MNTRLKDRLALPFPILQGPLRGRKWSLGTGGNYFRGQFEPEKMAAIKAAAREGDTAWDIGAHRGYVSLLLSHSVGPLGQVYCFEPDSSNLRLLKRHLRWNHCSNTRVFAGAVSNRDGTASFRRGRSSLAGKLTEEGDESVQTFCPLTLIREKQCTSPIFLKIDAEGSEAQILTGFGGWLNSTDLAVVVSTDSLELHEACREILEARGLCTLDSGKRFQEEPWRRFGDVELFAFGKNRLPSAELRELITAIAG